MTSLCFWGKLFIDRLFLSGVFMLKLDVLRFLDTYGAKSGGYIAGNLGVSRTAVWKTVNELCSDGFSIDKTKDGYLLSDSNLPVFEGQLVRILKGYNLHFFKELPSTNLTAKTLADGGATEKTVVLALKQTSGRGRLSRKFYSPFGGAYLSVILKPSLSPENTVLITTAAAVAAARVIERFSGKTAQIKWVNDIYIDSKKVCGILTEGAFNAETQALDYAVLGIGFDLFGDKSTLPEDIKDIADFIFDKQPTSLDFCRFLNAFLEEFFGIYEKVEQKEFLAEYNSRSFLLGKQITYLKDGVLHTAKALHTNEQAHLLVEEDGQITSLFSGEVSVKC